jgi:hypothetical protein
MKTAIEWLVEEMSKTYIFNQDDFDMFKQAKEIEKQQIELAFLTGKRNGIQICQYNSKAKEIKAEQYYNETFKK